jgi:hypothetical protein
MKLPLKNVNTDKSISLSENGSSLTLVLFFAAIGMITVFSYLLHQIAYAKPSLRSPSSLQALFNARSGIYRAFYHIIDSTAIDTLKTINTLDSAFGASMFGEMVDSTPIPKDKPGLDGVPITYDLFGADSLGDCDVMLEPAGGKCKLTSTGRFHAIKRHVTAMLGCRVPALPDTVVIYHSSYEWLGNKPGGTVVSSTDNVSINSTWYNSLIDRYQTSITETDTLLLDLPLTIQGNNDLKKIKSTVNGSLLIDGNNSGITWNDTGTVVIKGDCQFTGDVTIHGITFIASGEIKILDDSKFDQVNVFSSSRIFIGDNASFQGNALALHSITVYGKATIRDKSSLIAGSNRASSSGTTSGDSLKFSIFLSEESTINAVCIALETPGSIKTDLSTQITGILWAQHYVCHRGKMKGLIYATRVVDCDDPLQMATESTLNSAIDNEGKKVAAGSLVPGKLYNAIPGEIEPLSDIAMYDLPFFMGRLSIVSWSEE